MNKKRYKFLAALLALMLIFSAVAYAAAATPAINLNRLFPSDYPAVDYDWKAGVTSDAEYAASPLQIERGHEPKAPSGISLKTLLINTDGKSPAMQLNVYYPRFKARKNLPVIYFTHAGGFIFRKSFYDYERYQKLANDTGAAVVTPRYQIASENPFPMALYNAMNGLKYVYNNADKLGTTQNIILMGEGAGGGLAAALAIYNRDNDNIPLAGEILVYPMLDSNTGSAKNVPGNWSNKAIAYAWGKYVGGQPIAPELKNYFAPALTLATDLTNLPPAYIFVGDQDIFAPEAKIYAAKLTEAGVKTNFRLAPNVNHGFDLDEPTAGSTKDFWEETYNVIDAMFAGKY